MILTFICWFHTGLLAAVMGQKLIVFPQEIKDGLDQFDAQCFYHPNTARQSTLSEMTIQFAEDKANPVFETLATVSVKNGMEKATDANTSGAIDQERGSWLNLSWAHPSLGRAGIYGCEVHVLTKDHKSRTLTMTLKVKRSEPEVRSAFDLSHDQDPETDDLSGYFASWKNQVEYMRRLYFQRSEIYNGHRYYLSKIHSFTVGNDAEAKCEFLGGYLAEYETEAEFQFIRSFLSGYPAYDGVMTAGTDELVEGYWVSQYANKPLAMIQWGRGEPNQGRRENCMSLWRDLNWAAADAPCTVVSEGFKYGYLCEIPEEKN